MKENTKNLKEMLMELNMMLLWQKREKIHKRNMDMEPGEHRILMLLRLKTDLSRKELASVLPFGSRPMEELLKKLEKRGYIRFESKEEERIHLTDQGFAAILKLEQKAEEVTDIFDKLSDEDLADLERILRTLTDSIKEEIGEEAVKEAMNFHPFHGRDFKRKCGFGMEEHGLGRRGYGHNAHGHNAHGHEGYGHHNDNGYFGGGYPAEFFTR